MPGKLADGSHASRETAETLSEACDEGLARGESYSASNEACRWQAVVCCMLVVPTVGERHRVGISRPLGTIGGWKRKGCSRWNDRDGLRQQDLGAKSIHVILSSCSLRKLRCVRGQPPDVSVADAYSLQGMQDLPSICDTWRYGGRLAMRVVAVASAATRRSHAGDASTEASPALTAAR